MGLKRVKIVTRVSIANVSFPSLISLDRWKAYWVRMVVKRGLLD